MTSTPRATGVAERLTAFGRELVIRAEIQAMARRKRIFTIGYEEHRESDSLISALAEAGIERV